MEKYRITRIFDNHNLLQQYDKFLLVILQNRFA